MSLFSGELYIAHDADIILGSKKVALSAVIYALIGVAYPFISCSSMPTS